MKFRFMTSEQPLLLLSERHGSVKHFDVTDSAGPQVARGKLEHAT
jgi:hypothetical protein